VQALARDLPDARVETPDASAMPDCLTQSPGDVVLCSLQPAAGSASELLQTIKQTLPDCPVIWYAAPGEEDLGVLALAGAMRSGLDDYIGRLDSPAISLAAAIRQALDRTALSRANAVAMLRSERNYRALFENNPQAMFVFNPKTLRFLAVNAAALKQYGYTREEFLALRATDIRPAAEVPTLMDRLARLHTPWDRSTIWRHSKKDGTEMQVQIAGHLMNFGGEEALMVMVSDVTELQRTDRALRESEKRYRLLFESNPQPMWVSDLENYDFLAVNDAAIRHYGYSREEFLSMKVTDIRPPEEIERLLDHLRTIRENPGGMGDAGMWRHVKKDGTVLDSHVTWHALSFLGRPAELVLVNDVTERRKLEDQLRQAGRMEAIGRLAGGVAHDFNNLLSLIIGYSELLIEGLSPVDPRRKSAEEIRAAGQRAASLTRQLLAFSRKQVLQPEVLDLNEVAERTGKMLRRLIGEDIELVFKLEPKLHTVLADRGQIEQVLLNLAVNSRDAMPDGGVVTVETANVELDDSYARLHHPTKPGHYVMLAFSDTGHGMDLNTKGHIFEPFFTTKEMGKGTGLGLATVYGIVKQSDGYIWVYSEPGQGATFKIYLPPTGITIPVTATDESLAPASVHGGETILVVEDEAPLRELAADFLRACGYRVLEAGNGGDALELAATLTSSVDLLVTDVVMPGMSGRALAQRLAERIGDTKVLYLSGYTDEAIHRHGVLEPGVAFLQKPFRLADLARRAREILDNN
jgi:two-component system, cell cycle sensor histidine kinase and response regulator CckA